MSGGSAELSAIGLKSRKSPLHLDLGMAAKKRRGFNLYIITKILSNKKRAGCFSRPSLFQQG